MSITPVYGWPYQALGDAPNGPTLGEALALAVEATVAGIDAALDAEVAARTGMGSAGINNLMSTLDSNSATYINLTNASFSFTKAHGSAATKILAWMTCGAWTSVAATGPRIGLLIDGTDYDMGQRTITETLSHKMISGFRIITGIAAGTYTIQGRIRRAQGAGGTNSVRTNSEDWLSILLMEVPV